MGRGNFTFEQGFAHKNGPAVLGIYLGFAEKSQYPHYSLGPWLQMTGALCYYMLNGYMYNVSHYKVGPLYFNVKITEYKNL